VSISNCHVLSQTATFPNNPSGWVTLDTGDTCRANGDQWALTLRPNTSIILQNNTSVGYGTVMYDLECSMFVANCNGGKVLFKNNISKGYPDPANSGQLASGIYLGPAQTQPAQAGLSTANVTVTNNLWNTMRTGCPNSTTPHETNAVCADPLFVSGSNIDAINPALRSSSRATGLGASLTSTSPPPVKTPQ
jgi:hypothetical protein